MFAFDDGKAFTRNHFVQVPDSPSCIIIRVLSRDASSVGLPKGKTLFHPPVLD